MSFRIDKYMVDQKMVRTRSQARMLIKQGDVICDGQKVSKPGFLVDETSHIEILQREIYVSRGAFKLLKAIEEFQIDFRDKIVADCGASTGGFTQVCLLNGAKKVYAIDVGHDQLDTILRSNLKVINREGVNLKYPIEIEQKVDFCVADLSFISLKQVYLNIDKILKPSGKSIVLIKPQFEAGKERVGKKGIVKESFQQEILQEVLDWFKSHKFIVEKTCESPVLGKSGNKEYLALISKGF
ncbi:MAG: TlyA family RNA methyltransferase [Bacteriovoracaceae bacterium]|nr:TlyA family RNA methyltransferase [Bacteriovoracaceae bacterium]